MRYHVVSPILTWSFEANSLEEAHAKSKSSAGRWLYLWRDPDFSVGDVTRKEIIRILHGKFEVEKDKNDSRNYLLSSIEGIKWSI